MGRGMGLGLGDVPRGIWEAVGELRVTLSALSLARYSVLLLILLVTVGLRLLPVRYGVYISEFDPWLQFYAADFIADSVLEGGPLGVLDFFDWHSSITWYPEGVDMGTVYFPGVPMAGAFFYLGLLALGLDVGLETAVIYFPIVTGVLSVVFAYLLGRRLGGEVVGMLGAFFFSVSPAFMARSGLGWFDTETMGMLAMLAALYFFVEAMSPRRGVRGRYVFASLSGVFIGIMAASWGAFLYLLGTLALFSIAAWVLGLFPEGFRRPHAMMMVLALVLAASVPRNGVAFLYNPVALLVYAAVVLPFFSRVRLRLSWRGALYLVSSVIGLALLVPQLAAFVPVNIGARYLAVVNPFAKFDNPLVQSVQEHVGAGLVSFFVNTGMGFLLPFVVYGMYLMVREVDVKKLLMLVLGASSLYFASSFARLGTLGSPFLALVGAFGIYGILDPLYGHLVAEGRGRKQARKRVRESRSYVLAGLALVVVLGSVLVFPMARDAGDSPVTLASASTSLRGSIPDWIEALEWVRMNTPGDAVVAAWWDYGYWLSFIGERRSLADNGTMNQTRIELLAAMFLSDEETALGILEDLDADYVAVYIVPFPLTDPNTFEIFGYCFLQCIGTAGEEGKFVQMARIAGIDETRFINATGQLLPEFWATFLGGLIPYEWSRSEQGLDVYQEAVKYPREFDEGSALTLVFSSSRRSVAEVLIYRVERYTP